MAVIKFITTNPKNSEYIEKYKDDEAISAVIGYIFRPEKTQGYIGGWAVNPRNAAYEMEMVSALYHKRDGVRLRHWVISFADHEVACLERIGECSRMQAIYELSQLLSFYYANQHQIVFAVHSDSNLINVHFVMNNVSYVDGHKNTGTYKEYHDYINYCKAQLEPFGITLLEKKDRAAEKFRYF